MTEPRVREDRSSLKQIRARLDAISARLSGRDLAEGGSPFDIQSFIENLKIVNKEGRLVSLIVNRSQEIVFERLMEKREQGKPARFICCKSRQLGVSTLIEAFVFALITRYPFRFGLVVAHSIESAQTIFATTRRFHRYLPPAERRNLARGSTRVLEYLAPHSSRMQIDTAANRNLGRGGTVHYVHASEVAFWERAEEPVLAINQSVPRSRDTLIFWESTANGAHNLFHRTWLAAERGETDMEPIFLSWKGFPFYSLPIGPGERLDCEPDETTFQKNHGLSDGQMKWALFTKKNQCHNSWDKFHQEYPVEAYLAFRFTGMPWFDREAVRQMLEDTARPPLMKGRMEFVSDEVNEPRFVEDPGGPVSVWKKPDPGFSYSLGMDVGEGVGADFTVIQVICNDTGEVVASYRSNRVRAESAGVDAYLLGSWYNTGLLGIERNGPGLAVLAACERGLSEYPWMRGYPNLYYHTVTDRKIPEETRRMGWITNRGTKEAMLSRLAQAVDHGSLTVFNRTTLLEMQGFVWDAQKKTFRQNYTEPGSHLDHDDEIMALGIAWEMRMHTWENRFIPAHVPTRGTF